MMMNRWVPICVWDLGGLQVENKPGEGGRAQHSSSFTTPSNPAITCGP